MLRIIAIVVVVLIAGVLGFAATRPDSFRIQRATRIKAPAETIFALIDDLHSWGAWSPWEKVDPAMSRTHSGAASGKGAVYEWSGNRNIGQGRMEITDSSPPSALTIDLHFIKPFEARNTAEFTLRPAADATEVTWAMQGSNTFLSKLIGVFINMDEMIGEQFETGLANLKALTEK